MRNSKHAWHILVFVLVLVLSAALLFGCGKKAEEEPVIIRSEDGVVGEIPQVLTTEELQTVVAALPGAMSWPVDGGTITRVWDPDNSAAPHFGIDIGPHRDETSQAYVTETGDLQFEGGDEGFDETTPTPVLAAMDGTIAVAKKDSGYGNYVIIDHGNGIRTLYAHCAELSVSEGATVKKGDQIAIMGNTGNSTGMHLHFEVTVDGKAADPNAFIF